MPAHSYSRAVSFGNMVHTTNPPPEQWPTTARVHGPVIAIVTETLARLSTHRGGVATEPVASCSLWRVHDVHERDSLPSDSTVSVVYCSKCNCIATVCMYLSCGWCTSQLQ